jgi:hypothetical protein
MDARIAPIIATAVSLELTIIICVGHKIEMRINPYPPNFSKIAAKIIEPATGAST